MTARRSPSPGGSIGVGGGIDLGLGVSGTAVQVAKQEAYTSVSLAQRVVVVRLLYIFGDPPGGTSI